MMRPWYVAISGFMGTGKTTVARGLAAAMGWTSLPESAPAIHLLKDMFADPERWAFETQAAFLINKGFQLQEALAGRDAVVLDRTLYEDAEIFAKYFYDKGYIDERSYGTYVELTEHFFREIPPPDLVIYCDCSFEVAESRLLSHPKEFTKSYPPNHLKEISQRYSEWISSYNRSNLAVLDTEKIDTRKPGVIQKVADEVRHLLFEGRNTQSQSDLFLDQEGVAGPSLLRPVTVRQGSPDQMKRIPLPTPTVRVTTYPTAYLAAPFTGFSTAPSPEEDSFLLAEPPHGAIEPGPYRSFLLDIEKSLKQLGISTFLPHRDVNRWGHRVLSARQVMSQCSDYVQETDLFVGLLGLSHGSHYEFGLAYGMGKPCILIRCGDISESFVASGAPALKDRENVHVVEISSFEEIQPALGRDEVKLFLRQFLPIRWR